MQVNPLKQLYNDFLSILDDAVVKFKYEADSKDDIDMKREADQYVTASLMEDTFFTYYRYEKDIISLVLGITDEDQINKYHMNRNEIPIKYRDELVKKQRKFIIDNYVEKNNYYRKLNGLPNYEETPLDYVFIDYEICDKYNIPRDIPIHMLDSTHVTILDSVGYVKTLIEKYPTKYYLKYIGDKKIDIVTARTARSFGLLRVPTRLTDALLSSFLLIYEQCREYFMSCIYVPEFRQTIKYYDGFIGLCIMVMTIQQIIARVTRTTVDRDFFDPYCCKILFDAYGVPYDTAIDSNTRTQLVQNLNMLIQNKGTNKVIFDIGSILGYDRLELYKYYLMKVRKFDMNGIPLEYYKTDELTGEQVPDYERMYDIYFQKVYIDDEDVYDSLVDQNNRTSYNEVVENDPYWIDDADLQKELYESEYNFVESKYMGISISYRLTKLLFENIYLLRMLLDKKNDIIGITLDLPKLSSSKTISLFDTVVILCALSCKQNNLSGNIVKDPSQILHVIGFNFERDFSLIKEEILNDPNLDDSLCDFFKDPTAYTPEKINNLYTNYVNLYDVLVNKMSTTNNIDIYHAYKKLYNTIFYSNETSKMFNIGTTDNPVYAKTYKEYLQYTNPDIYDIVENSTSENIYSYIEYISAKLTEVIPNLKHFGFFAGSSNLIEKLLIKLIRFFKSYTTDMINMNTVYIFDIKPNTLLRLIDKICIESNVSMNDEFPISYSDTLSFTSIVDYRTSLMYLDKIRRYVTWCSIYDSHVFYDHIKNIHNDILVNSKVKLNEYIKSIVDNINITTKILFEESVRIYNNICINTGMSYDDLVKSVIILTMNDRSLLSAIVSLITNMKINDKCMFSYDDIGYKITNVIQSIVNFTDNVSIRTANQVNTDSIPLFDVNSIDKTTSCNSKISFRDTCKITYF